MQRIILTEKQLNKIITDSLAKILKENSGCFVKLTFDKISTITYQNNKRA